jgi:hypothetical protein
MRKTRTIFGNSDRFPTIVLHSLRNSKRELFHTDDKKIRGKRIPLP